jgi:hypothetical protein
VARLGPTTSLVRTTLPAARARPCDRRGARKKYVGVVKNRNDFILSERPVGIFVRRFEDRLHQRLPRASGVGRPDPVSGSWMGWQSISEGEGQLVRELPPAPRDAYAQADATRLRCTWPTLAVGPSSFNGKPYLHCTLRLLTCQFCFRRMSSAVEHACQPDHTERCGSGYDVAESNLGYALDPVRQKIPPM